MPIGEPSKPKKKGLTDRLYDKLNKIHKKLEKEHDCNTCTHTRNKLIKKIRR